MDAGSLIHRVTLQVGTETSDGHDGFTEGWSNTDRRRMSARIRALSGRDLETARQVNPLATHEVTVRWWMAYDTDVTGGRSRWIWHDGVIGDRTLEIVEPPREVEPRVMLVMLCKESQ